LAHGVEIELMKLSWSALGSLVTMLVAVQAQAQSEPHWMLMSRHGDCAPVSTLKRKLPELDGRSQPEAVAALIRQKGMDATLHPMPVPKGRAVQLTSVQAGLDLVFVTTEFCAP
jgi:hypothetical protein